MVKLDPNNIREASHQRALDTAKGLGLTKDNDGCTAGGAVIDNTLFAFKVMDLARDYLYDEIIHTEDGLVACFPREEGIEGTTMGANAYGLFLGGLDFHINREVEARECIGIEISEIYLDTLKQCRTIDEAIIYIQAQFEKRNIDVPDMIFIAGSNDCGGPDLVVLEYNPFSNEQWKKDRSQSMMYATNTPRNHGKFRPSREDDPDSYAREARAIELITNAQGLDDFIALTRDHEDGQNQNSICRHIDLDTGSAYNLGGQYETKGAMIMELNLSSGSLKLHYAFGHPCKNVYKTLEL